MPQTIKGFTTSRGPANMSFVLGSFAINLLITPMTIPNFDESSTTKRRDRGLISLNDKVARHAAAVQKGDPKIFKRTSDRTLKRQSERTRTKEARKAKVKEAMEALSEIQMRQY